MADVSSEISPDFFKMKVPDLEKELKLRGLSTTGNETELLKDSPTSMKSPDVAGLESVDDLEENLLNDDDDDEHLDANESVKLIGTEDDTSSERKTKKKVTLNRNETAVLENELDESFKNLKKKLFETVDGISNEEEPPKKVILNRNESAVLKNELDESLKPLKRKLIETVDDTSSKEEPPKKGILTTEINQKSKNL